jgi:hypothetical protein
LGDEPVQRQQNNIEELSSYLRENTSLLHYEDQMGNAVDGNSLRESRENVRILCGKIDGLHCIAERTQQVL